jgi:hypothetical protein
MSFLPDNYVVPSSDSNYFKPEKGTNRVRILSKPILGMEYWKTVDGTRKPLRKPMGFNISLSELEEDPQTGEINMPRHFWAMVVWNIKLDKPQVWEITQKRIQKAIEAMSRSKDWGDPTQYDIEIEREGEKLETTYTIRPCPKNEFDGGKLQMVKDMNISLEALFEGSDPFGAEKLTREDFEATDTEIKKKRK